MNQKKLLSFLSLLLIASVLLAACAPAATPAPATAAPTKAEAPTTAPNKAPEATKAPEVTKAPEATKAPAATPTAAKPAFYEIRWLVRAVAQKDVEKVQTALNALLDKKYPNLNFHVKLDIIGRAEYSDKIALINASGEAYDMGFTASWTNNFWSNVQQGYLAPLDDLLAKYGQGVVDSMPKGSLTAARVGSKIFAIPMQLTWVQPWGPGITQEALDASGTKDMFYAMKTMDDLTPWMQKVYDALKGKGKFEGLTNLPQYTNQYGTCDPMYWGYDQLFSHDIVVKQDDATVTPVIWPTTPEFKKCVDMMVDWNKRGFFLKQSLKVDESIAAVRDGRIVNAGCCGDTSPSILANYANQTTKPAVALPMISRPLMGSELTRNMMFISATSKNKERTMQFINLLHTDVELYNLVANGIEGTHWVWVDQAKKLIGFPQGVDAKTTGYYPGVPYIMGNMLNSYYWDKVAAANDEYGNASKNNFSAKLGYAMGFGFDMKPVEKEIASMAAVKGEYSTPLGTGQITTDSKTAIDKYMTDLKKAGIEKVLAEYVKQIAAWKASK